MEKRLTRTDYLFAALTIFMLVSIVGAFFIGFTIGQNKTENRYKTFLTAQNELMEDTGSYSGQTLVSFYHNMYLPFKSFQDSWFQSMNALEANSENLDKTSSLKDLIHQANETYDLLAGKTIPDHSPLLKQAHAEFVASLKQFASGMKSFTSKTGTMSGSDLLTALNSDAKITDAKHAALQGQRNFYLSMVKWYQTFDTTVHASTADQNWSIDEWSRLPLLVKNQYIAEQMLAKGAYNPYLPQDLAVRIDDLIATGQTDKLGISSVLDAIQLLDGTQAVRNDDFIKLKNKHYYNELLPEIPFFYNELASR